MRVLLVYKNMAENREVSSHTGLGVTAQNIARQLRPAGIDVEVVPVFDGYELRDKILPNREDITHVIMFAPWLDSTFLQALIRQYPFTAFSVTCHSNVGFLQADKHAVKLIREGMELELINHNFHVAANCERLADAITTSFRRPCALLPNLYDMGEEPDYLPYQPGTMLRLGVFGAMRPQKNMLTAAWAGLQIARRLNARCEIAINSGRVEGGNSVLGAIRELLAGLNDVTLVEAGWMTWPKFRSFVRDQHLLLSPSYTESFCNVTADGIVEGVPSVVSSAIDWAPDRWKADPDSVRSIADTGIMLLKSQRQARQGWPALERHNKFALQEWLNYLDCSAVYRRPWMAAA
jgi:hypothetical protein